MSFFYEHLETALMAKLCNSALPIVLVLPFVLPVATWTRNAGACSGRSSRAGPVRWLDRRACLVTWGLLLLSWLARGGIVLLLFGCGVQ